VKCQNTSLMKLWRHTYLLLLLLWRSDATNRTNEKNINSRNVMTQDEHRILNDGLQVEIFKLKLEKICITATALFVCFWCDSLQWARASSFARFLDHTQRRTTVGRTTLNEWSARRRDLYLTTHNTHNRQISIPPVGFEPTISASERPQTYALNRAVTGTGYATTKTAKRN
jgi:hypothetical protein